MSITPFSRKTPGFGLGLGFGLSPSSHRAMAAVFVLSAALVQAPNAYAGNDTVTVGGGANCDFNHLQAAVDSIELGGSKTIRLTNEAGGFVAEPILMVGRNVEIIGGYSSCSDQTANGAQHSVIRGNGGNLPVVFASGFANAEPTSLKLTSVIVENGDAEFGGGIRVGAKYDTRLSNVIVRDNFAMNAGGGIYLDGSNGATLRLEHDTQVIDNASGQHGGGVYCVNGEVDYRTGAIDRNETGTHGAGVFLSSCEMTGNAPGFRSLSDNRIDMPRYAPPSGSTLAENGASGGGLFAYAGSDVTLGSRHSTTLIADNQIRQTTGSDPDRGHGGGVYAANAGTKVELTNAHIVNNLAMLGGGVYVFQNAQFELSRSISGCVAHPDYTGCASISNNTANGFSTGDGSICVASDSSWAGQGGALFVAHLSRAVLDGVYVNENRIVREDQCVFTEEVRYPHGAAFYIVSASTLEIFNTLVHRNDGVDEDDIIHLAGTNPEFTAVHSAIVGNSSSVDGVIRTGGTRPRVELYSSTVISPGVPGFENDGAEAPTLIADCLYATNPSNFSNVPGAIVTNAQAGNNPGFVNGSNSDFRLNEGSDGQDACGSEYLTLLGFSDRAIYDLDARRRPVVYSDPDRPWDIGPYERQGGTTPRLTDLAVSIDDGGLNYGPNSTMGYTLTLTNEGPAAANNAGFRVNLPTQIGNYSVIPFSADWDCVDGNATIICHYQLPLAAGATAPAVATQFVAPSVPTVLTGRITSLPGDNMVDPNDSNNRATETTSIGQDAGLIATLVEEPAFAAPGTRSVFRFSLENVGPDVAPSASITFTLHPQAEAIRVDEAPAGWTCLDPVQLPNQNWTIRCRRDVAAVATYEFAVSSRLPSPFIESEWSVQADVLSGADDPDPSDNEASGAAMVASASADLSLTGSSPDRVKLEEFIQYQVALENLGPGVAKQPVLSGRFAGGTMESFIVSPPSGWVCSAIDESNFECLAPDDVQVGAAQSFAVTAMPETFTAQVLELVVQAVSATDDPEVGPGSNNELTLVSDVDADPQPTQDLMFSNSFE
ncbi:MAG: hypothetical protein AB8B96_11105 [Lysobacterales bacterium]